MKQIDMTYDKTYWLRLAERYFEAETTSDEEAALRLYVTGNDDPDFDELRAVMGYSAVARRLAEPRKPAFRLRRIVAAAAVVLLLIGVAVPLLAPGDEYVAYVGGKRITDKEKVMQLMQNDMQSMTATDDDVIEQQMQDMLGTID